MSFEYVKEYYGVPAEKGRRITFYGKPGIIVADRGNYIGVTFDDQEPGEISNVHPTDNVEYLEMGKIRTLPKKKQKAKERYKRYLEFSDCFDSFIDFCRWDALPEHDWNQK